MEVDKKDNAIIRYVLSVGFLVFYTYLLFTTTSALAFCYIGVVFVILTVYVDLKLSIILGVYSFILNVAIVVKNAADIAANTQGITDNAANIADNAQAIVRNANAIAELNPFRYRSYYYTN